jgi:tetratricopeptide (TPR) repeat protein
MANARRVFGGAGPALGLYRRAAALYRALGDESSEGFALWGLAGSLRRLGRRKEARRSLDKAMALFKKSRDDRGIVMGLLALARLIESERGRKAHLPRAKALALARLRNMPYEAALASFEAARAPGRRPSAGPLARLGVPAAAARGWKDIP